MKKEGKKNNILSKHISNSKMIDKKKEMFKLKKDRIFNTAKIFLIYLWQCRKKPCQNKWKRMG